MQQSGTNLNGYWKKPGCWRGQVGEGQSTDLDVQPTRDAHLASEKKASTARREATGENTIEVPLSEEEVIKIPLNREEPVIEKEVHVTGGVRLRKTEGLDKETIRETVRRENVDVDESGKTTVIGDAVVHYERRKAMSFPSSCILEGRIEPFSEIKAIVPVGTGMVN